MKLKQAPQSSFSLVAAGTSLSGDLVFNEKLIIAGKVNGSITCTGDDSSELEIMDGGQLIGEINAPNIKIDGRVEATINASQLVTIGRSAHVSGVIKFNQLSVSPGAIVSGELITQRTAGSDNIKSFGDLTEGRK